MQKFRFFSTSPLKIKPAVLGENLLNMTSVECEFVQTTVLDFTQPFLQVASPVFPLVSVIFATQNRVISYCDAE